MYDVLSIGSATLDVFLRCDDLAMKDIEGHRQFVFRAGSKTEVSSGLFETGGGGTNTATTFKRQGLKTGIIAKIGKDFPAEKILQRMHEEGIDTTYVAQSDKNATDYSTIIWKPENGSVIFVTRGKGQLEAKDIPWDTIETSWLYITSVEENFEIIRSCQNNLINTRIAWNPGKRELKQPGQVREIANHVYVFNVNKSEMQALLESSSDTIVDIMKAAQILTPEYLMITDGHNGSYVRHAGTWIHAGIFDTERVEATGAGDAFGSGFVAGLIRGYSTEQCVKLASANAASVVRSPSAKKGILKKDGSMEWIGKELEITTLT